MIHTLYKNTIILNWKWISEMHREMLWCDKREVESEKERTRKLMNNDSAGRTIGASGLILSLLFSCLNIYFPPAPVSPVISVMGERWRRQLYEINALRDYGASSSWIRESRASRVRESICISANKKIFDLRLFHFFHATCPSHFIASHRYLNSAAVVGLSIFCSATGDYHKTRRENVRRRRKKYISRLH